MNCLPHIFVVSHLETTRASRSCNYAMSALGASDLLRRKAFFLADVVDDLQCPLPVRSVLHTLPKQGRLGRLPHEMRRCCCQSAGIPWRSSSIRWAVTPRRLSNSSRVS